MSGEKIEREELIEKIKGLGYPKEYQKFLPYYEYVTLWAIYNDWKKEKEKCNH